MELTRIQLAERIAEGLNCPTRIWSKHGLVRVYLEGDRGYVSVGEKNVSWYLTTEAKKNCEQNIRDAIADVVIREPGSVVPGIRRLTQNEADELANAPRKPDKDDLAETTKRLDAMYGKDGWDDRDRIDLEG